jgi:hypothetical protein
LQLSFTDRLKAAIGLISGTTSQQALGMLAGILPGAVGNPPKRGTKELLNAYNTMPWLRAVVNRVGTSVASTPWQLYVVRKGGAGKAIKAAALQQGNLAARRQLMAGYRKAGELVEIEEHPLLDLINRPNSFHVGLTNRQIIQMHLDLAGEALWLKERNGLGKPAALWPLPPDWVVATPTPGHPFFRVSFRGWQGDIPDTEILWMVDPDPTNPYGRGSSMARALADELETDEYAAKHVKAWFYNRARPDLLIYGKDLSKDDTIRLEQDWLSKAQGFWKAFKPYFLGREVQVKELSQTFDNMQLVDLRKNERDTIIHVYGMPPEVLGIVENSNRATIDAADYMYARWILVPRLEFQRAFYQERLVPEYDDRLILDYVSPVAEDKEHNLKVAQAAPYALKVDDWRALRGEEPLPNDEGQVFMVPFNLIATRNLAEAKAPPSEPAAVDEVTPAEPATSPDDEDEGAEDPEKSIRASGCQHAKAIKALNPSDINKLLAALAVENLLEQMRPVYRDLVQAFGQELLDTLEVNATFDLQNPRVVEFLLTEAAEKVKGINKTTRERLRAELALAVEAGEGIPKVADRISAVFSDAKGRRSEVIARTEVVGASNFGSWQGMKQGGAAAKEWLSQRDGRTRGSDPEDVYDHVSPDGQRRNLDEPFDVSGEQLMYPGDQNGSPGNVIQCRCAIVPIVGELSMYDTEEKRVAAWTKYDSSLVPWERRMKTAAKKGFQAQQDAVMAELKQLGRESD